MKSNRSVQVEMSELQSRAVLLNREQRRIQTNLKAEIIKHPGSRHCYIHQIERLQEGVKSSCKLQNRKKQNHRR